MGQREGVVATAGMELVWGEATVTGRHREILIWALGGKLAEGGLGRLRQIKSEFPFCFPRNLGLGLKGGEVNMRLMRVG